MLLFIQVTADSAYLYCVHRYCFCYSYCVIVSLYCYSFWDYIHHFQSALNIIICS